MTRADSDGTTTMQDGVVIELTGRGEDGRPDTRVPAQSDAASGDAARSTGGSKPKTSVKRAFLRLLRTNKAYRLLWLSGFISQMGDWFNDIAVFVLLQRISGTSSMPVVCVWAVALTSHRAQALPLPPYYPFSLAWAVWGAGRALGFRSH